MDYTSLINFTFGASVGSSIIIFLSKKIIDKSFDLGIEKYKGKLNFELAQYRSDLDKELRKFSIEKEVTFHKLHEKRVVILNEISSLLYDIENNLINLTTLNQGSEFINDTDRDLDAKNAVTKFKNLFEINRFYFSNEMCNQFDNIVSESNNVLTRMKQIKNKTSRNDQKIRNQYISSPNERKEVLDKWCVLSEDVELKMKNTRYELAEEMRTIIGVE